MQPFRLKQAKKAKKLIVQLEKTNNTDVENRYIATKLYFYFKEKCQGKTSKLFQKIKDEENKRKTVKLLTGVKK